MISNSKPAGFSLIELLVVMAIISLLVAIVIPNVNQWLTSSTRDAERRQLQALVERAKFEAFAKAEDITLVVKGDRIETKQGKLLTRLEKLTCRESEVRVFPTGTMLPDKIECFEPSREEAR